jgi:hypothetical protein
MTSYLHTLNISYIEQSTIFLTSPQERTAFVVPGSVVLRDFTDYVSSVPANSSFWFGSAFRPLLNQNWTKEN